MQKLNHMNFFLSIRNKTDLSHDNSPMSSSPFHIPLFPQPQKISYRGSTLPLSFSIFLEFYGDFENSFLPSQFQEELREEFGFHSVELLIHPISEFIFKRDEWEEVHSFLEGSFGSLFSFQKNEFYVLMIDSDQIFIGSSSLHGLFNGFQTLRQILTRVLLHSQSIHEKFSLGDNNTSLSMFLHIPSLAILDWPLFEMRGITDDVSRGQIPNVEGLKRFLISLSRFKINYYVLYIEDVFKCSSHPSIGEDRGAFTPEELLEIVEFASHYYIEIFPIFESLGHVDNIVFHEEYHDLGEFPGAQCFAISNGNIYPFLRDFIGELSSCFRSPYFHIGCDETFDLGHGQSKDLIKAIGFKQALLDHYRRVFNIVKDAGKSKIILYHDSIAKIPKGIDELPAEIIFMYWDYMPKKEYPKALDFLKAGRSLIMSPSMLCWNRHFPDYLSAFKNIKGMIEYSKTLYEKGYAERLLGILTSTWGDFGQLNFRENNVYGAILTSAAWSSEPLTWESFIEAISIHLFHIGDSKTIQRFGSFFAKNIAYIRYYAKWNNLNPMVTPMFFMKFFRSPFRSKTYHSQLYFVKRRKEEIERFYNEWMIFRKEFLEEDGQYGYLLDYFDFSIQFLLLFFEKELLAKNLFHSPPSFSNDVLAYIGKLQSFRKQFEKLWLFAAKRPNIEYGLVRFEVLEEHLERFLTFLEQTPKIRKKLLFSQLNNRLMLHSPYIWTHEGISYPKPRYFRKEIDLPCLPEIAYVQIIAGNEARLYVNGQYVGETLSRFSLSSLPLRNSIKIFEITGFLQEGKNVIGVEANHYLNSFGSLNVMGYLLFPEEFCKVSSNPMLFSSDETWIYFIGDIKGDTEWSTPSFKVDECKWNRARIVGIPPEINSFIIAPDFEEGRASITEPIFGFSASLYYILSFLVGEKLAKIARPFLRRIAKLFN